MSGEITVNIELELGQILTIEDDMYKEILQEYDGDVKSWAQENWRDHLSLGDFEAEWSNVRIENSKEAIRDKMNQKREELAIDENGHQNISRTLLNWLKKLEVIGIMDKAQMREIYIDRNKLKIADKFCEYHSGSTSVDNAISHILIADDEMYATDTRRLIAINGINNQGKDIMLPKCFVQPIIDGGTLHETKTKKGEDIIVLFQSGKAYTCPRSGHKFRDDHYIINFPDAERILSSIWVTYKTITFDAFKAGLQERYVHGGDEILIDAKIDGESHTFDPSLLQSILDPANSFGIGTVHATGRAQPVHFTGPNVHLVIMPIIE